VAKNAWYDLDPLTKILAYAPASAKKTTLTASAEFDDDERPANGRRFPGGIVEKSRA